MDVMCGGLRSILRMLGYDTVYALDRDAETDDVLVEIAVDEDRLIVTRDVDLAARSDRSVLLESTDTDEQLDELRAAGFELKLTEPQRCSACNGPLLWVPIDGGGGGETSDPERDGTGPEDIELSSTDPVDSTPEGVPDPGEFRLWQCQHCGQYYWKGSHWDDVQSRL
ncbi:MAG: Mut7-C RNAse domain-containing protein [Halodesulfurarchaeum sp.]